MIYIVPIKKQDLPYIFQVQYITDQITERIDLSSLIFQYPTTFQTKDGIFQAYPIEVSFQFPNEIDAIITVIFETEQEINVNNILDSNFAIYHYDDYIKPNLIKKY